MEPRPVNSPFEGLRDESQENPVPAEVKSGHGTALVHILTAEFQGLNPEDFEDIGDKVVASASPEILRTMLMDVASDGHSVVSYQPPESGRKWIRLSVTPLEFGLFSRHIPMLAKTAINGVLRARDRKLRQETGNSTVRARGEDDLAAAYRSAIRQVRSKQYEMAEYLKNDIVPRIELVDKFIEMVANPNLVRGSKAAVKRRFEELRLVVFGDMLDAIGNQRKWTPEQAERRVRILQKRLYLEPDPIKRRENFEGMLSLAKEYYGSKRALIMGRIAESQKYFQNNPEALQDVAAKDAERHGG